MSSRNELEHNKSATDLDILDAFGGPTVDVEELADISDYERKSVEHTSVLPSAPSSDRAQEFTDPVAREKQGEKRRKNETKTAESKEEDKNLIPKKAADYFAPSLNQSEKWKAIYTLDDARRGVWQKPTFIIGNLLLAQSALLVSAHPHSMKSLAFLQAALEAAARQKVWGHFSTPDVAKTCLLYTSPSPRDLSTSRMPSSA